MENESDSVYQKRDLILTEIHTDVKYLREKVDDQKTALDNHKAEDKAYQEKVDSKIGWGIKIAVIILIIVAANGGMEALRVLFKVSP